ncbi:MAG: DUF432 domain-containing protein [Bacteroidales bacterium]|nr:DUF432 domain-containing protein [Bacteroidales bacterium]MBN2821200.1 DUF432 domain-containing protein [Bacteroidales bacterium]
MWAKYKIENKQTYLWHIGNFRFYIKRLEKEFLLAKFEEDLILNFEHEVLKHEKTPDTLVWKNYIADKTTSLNILPALPDKPLVIKTHEELYILPGRNTTIYVRIPLSLNFYAGAETEDNLITSEPSIMLSNTWFGDPDNGVPAYSLNSSVLYKTDDLQIRSFEIICPVKIINDSSQSFKLERLLLDVDHLKIYQGKQGLATNEVKIHFEGENNSSHTQFGRLAPGFISEPKLLIKERNTSNSSVLKKSFHFLKSGISY